MRWVKEGGKERDICTCIYTVFYVFFSFSFSCRVLLIPFLLESPGKFVCLR